MNHQKLSLTAERASANFCCDLKNISFPSQIDFLQSVAALLTNGEGRLVACYNITQFFRWYSQFKTVILLIPINCSESCLYRHSK